jgi:hypothetical protein
MLEYSEYKDVLEILERTNHDTTYQDLVKKEGKVLDTVNAVVKSYRDQNIRNIEFVNRPVAENISRFWLDMNLMIKELFDIVDLSDIPKIFTKGERVIYIGFLCIAIAIILFFVEISK